MDDLAPRIRSLENDLQNLLRRLEADEARLARAEQAAAKIWTGGAAGGGSDGGGGALPAMVNGGGIPAGSPGAPSTGNVALFVTDPSTGIMTASGSVILAYNYYASPVTASVLCYVQITNGIAQILQSDC